MGKPVTTKLFRVRDGQNTQSDASGLQRPAATVTGVATAVSGIKVPAARLALKLMHATVIAVAPPHV